jgi:hypothetical protein
LIEFQSIVYKLENITENLKVNPAESFDNLKERIYNEDEEKGRQEGRNERCPEDKNSL